MSGFAPERRPFATSSVVKSLIPWDPTCPLPWHRSCSSTTSMPPLRLAQRASDLLRELNLLLCGATEDELQHILAAMAATQALATARLREERGHIR